jgi:hypothetical protein
VRQKKIKSRTVPLRFALMQAERVGKSVTSKWLGRLKKPFAKDEENAEPHLSVLSGACL